MAPNIEEELRLDAEEDAREVKYIQNALPSELKEKFDTGDIYYMLDAIVEYYFSSGILENEPDDDGYIDVDLQQVAEYVCKKAKEDKRDYAPDDVFFVAQADLDYQMEEPF